MENRNFMALTDDELYEVNGGDDCDKSGLMDATKDFALGLLGVISTIGSIFRVFQAFEDQVAGDLLIPSGTYTEPDDVCPDDWDGTWTTISYGSSSSSSSKSESSSSSSSSTSNSTSSGKKSK